MNVPHQPWSPMLGRRGARWPWLAIVLDVGLVSATPQAATMLEYRPLVLALTTLGGHPATVQLLALSAMVLLAWSAIATQASPGSISASADCSRSRAS